VNAGKQKSVQTLIKVAKKIGLKHTDQFILDCASYLDITKEDLENYVEETSSDISVTDTQT
jgi:hypothetical protein